MSCEIKLIVGRVVWFLSIITLVSIFYLYALYPFLILMYFERNGLFALTKLANAPNEINKQINK